MYDYPVSWVPEEGVLMNQLAHWLSLLNEAREKQRTYLEEINQIKEKLHRLPTIIALLENISRGVIRTRNGAFGAPERSLELNLELGFTWFLSSTASAASCVEHCFVHQRQDGSVCFDYAVPRELVNSLRLDYGPPDAPLEDALVVPVVSMGEVMHMQCPVCAEAHPIVHHVELAAGALYRSILVVFCKGNPMILGERLVERGNVTA